MQPGYRPIHSDSLPHACYNIQHHQFLTKKVIGLYITWRMAWTLIVRDSGGGWVKEMRCHSLLNVAAVWSATPTCWRCKPLVTWKLREEPGGWVKRWEEAGEGRRGRKKERKIKLKHSYQCYIFPPEKCLLCTKYRKCVFYWGEGEGTIRNSVTLYHCEK